MKKHITHLILLLLITSCSINKKAHSIGEFKFKLPKKAIAIKPENLDANSPINEKKIPSKYIYKIDDIYLGIEDPIKATIDKKLLEEDKKDRDNYYKKQELIELVQYHSIHIKINDNEAFIMYKCYKNSSQYIYKMVNKDNTQVFTGTLVFENQSNYNEATKILINFLKSVQF